MAVGLGLAAEDAAVIELREVISKIVETEALRTKEAADWEERKASMAELLGLHRRELALLGEELEKSGGSAEGFAARKDEKLGEIERLKAAREAVREAVSRSRPRMLALAGRFPQVLAEEVGADRQVLEDWRAEDEPRPALQAILAMVGAAEQFNRRITRAIEIRDGREVEVLYLGLARGYYADRRGHAGVGVPGPDGWRWEARKDLSGAVVSALDQLDRKRPPELVELPVAIDGGEGRR